VKNFCLKIYFYYTYAVVQWCDGKGKQEAQLSQRNHATLYGIEYFAKLLKVTQGHSK